MVSTIRPHGAIADSLVTSIRATQDGIFYVYDCASNRMEISKEEYEKLKKKGVEERNDYLKRINSNQL